MASFCGINRIYRIASFTGDGLVRVLLKLYKAINENAISSTLKKLGQNGARKLQSYMLSNNRRRLKGSGLTNITLAGLYELAKQTACNILCNKT